jgi:hypothetical protein
MYEFRKRSGRRRDNADAWLLAFYKPRSSATDWFEAAMGGFTPVDDSNLVMPGIAAA